jgi:hypothetical protein
VTESQHSEHTTAKLARALSEVPGMPEDMIKRAIDGFYHDYLSPLTFPEIQLVSDLKALARLPTTGPKAKAALIVLARRVADGDFDASKEESDAWAASEEGRETFRQLADDVVFGGIVRQMHPGDSTRKDTK